MFIINGYSKRQRLIVPETTCSISNDLTQMVNFPTRIPDCNTYSPALLDLFISSDTLICSTMAFLLLGNSDHVVVSVSIDFPSSSLQDALFYCKAYARMTQFSTNPYFIFRSFECYTTPIVKELLYNKNQIFYFYFKTCRNLHNYNLNKHIKQHNKTILRYNKIVQSSSYCQKETVQQN